MTPNLRPDIPYRRRLLPAAIVLLALLAGCGSSSPVDTRTNARFNLTLSPNPAPVVASTRAGYTWSTTITGTIVMQAGTGARFESVQTLVNEAFGGIEVPGAPEDYVVTIDAPISSLPGGSTATFTLVIDYTLPSGNKEILIQVAITVIDDYNARLADAAEAGAF